MIITRIRDRIQEEVIDLFYDYDDKYEEALNNGIDIYNYIAECDIALPRKTMNDLMITIIDAANQLNNVKIAEKFIEIAELNIKSIKSSYRIMLGKAQLFAIKRKYKESIALYDILEKCYRELEDEVMLGVIEYHKGMYFNSNVGFINALRYYIETFDYSILSIERVSDTYNKINQLTLNAEEKIQVEQIKNELEYIGMAI